MVKKWIQKANLKEGRVRKYLRRIYGNKAFTSKGTIKLEYLDKAIERAKREGNTSLVRALNLAKTLRKLAKKR